MGSIMQNMLAESAHPQSQPKLMLWHTANNSDSLKSFLDKGALPVGKGEGGQTDGFYAWNKKEAATSHFQNFLHKESAGEGLLVGVAVDPSEITYPRWQFDLELSRELNPLFFKYKDQIGQIQNLEYMEDGKKKTISSMRPTFRATEDNCVIQFKENHRLFSLAVGQDNGIRGVNVFQALVDTMCENPEFRQDYDKLLRDSLQKSERLAIKYCGKEALPVAEVSHIQKEAEKPASEEKLFTSSQKKERQVCPFLKMALNRLKNGMGG